MPGLQVDCLLREKAMCTIKATELYSNVMCDVHANYMESQINKTILMVHTIPYSCKGQSLFIS